MGLSLEWIEIQSGSKIVVFLFIFLRNSDHFLNFLPIRRWQHFRIQSARHLLRLLGVEDPAANDINVEIRFRLQIEEFAGRRIELENEIMGASMRLFVLADFVRSVLESEVVQVANDAALVENVVGGSFQNCLQFNLKERVRLGSAFDNVDLN